MTDVICPKCHKSPTNRNDPKLRLYWLRCEHCNLNSTNEPSPSAASAAWLYAYYGEGLFLCPGCGGNTFYTRKYGHPVCETCHPCGGQDGILWVTASEKTKKQFVT